MSNTSGGLGVLRRGTVLGAVYDTAARSDSADAMFMAMTRRSCAAIRELTKLDAWTASL